MEQLLSINPERISESEMASFEIRESSRAVVFDKKRRVALLHVGTHEYYKLPGGSVEEGENPQQAILRECKEELGCAVHVHAEVGCITEYRSKHNCTQISYCYVAMTETENAPLALTEREIENQCVPVWTDMRTAIRWIEAAKPNSYGGRFVQLRDLTFLKKALEMLELEACPLGKKRVLDQDISSDTQCSFSGVAA